MVTANAVWIKNWQKQYQLAEDALDNPRTLALRDATHRDEVVVPLEPLPWPVLAEG